MAATRDPGFIIDERDARPAAYCVVCGNAFAAGAGLTARYEGHTLRFKCPGCLARFGADPERYLTGGLAGCCGGRREGAPASEWAVD